MIYCRQRMRRIRQMSEVDIIEARCWDIRDRIMAEMNIKNKYGRSTINQLTNPGYLIKATWKYRNQRFHQWRLMWVGWIQTKKWAQPLSTENWQTWVPGQKRSSERWLRHLSWWCISSNHGSEVTLETPDKSNHLKTANWRKIFIKTISTVRIKFHSWKR